MNAHATLIDALADATDTMRRRALAADAAGTFPAADIAFLHEVGLLVAPLPVAQGGLGMGTEPEGAHDLWRALRLLGRGSLVVGRLFEAHVNAIKLVVRYGTQGQVAAVVAEARAGRLLGLWVTDAPDAPLRLGTDGVLRGAKAPCSGAGHLRAALMTAALPDGGIRMVLVRLAPEEASARAAPLAWDMQGMRASASGRMVFDGLRIAPEAVIGADGDYLRQPEFSVGAWRTSAVTLGGLDALVEAVSDRLVARGRADDPHQLARMGTLLVARETAALFTGRAALIGEDPASDAGDAANYVNLARIATEAACLDALREAQRALGLEIFRRGFFVELLLRDLAVYLRQPAPDITLTEAASHFLRRALP